MKKSLIKSNKKIVKKTIKQSSSLLNTSKTTEENLIPITINAPDIKNIKHKETGASNIEVDWKDTQILTKNERSQYLSYIVLNGDKSSDKIKALEMLGKLEGDYERKVETKAAVTITLSQNDLLL